MIRLKEPRRRLSTSEKKIAKSLTTSRKQIQIDKYPIENSDQVRNFMIKN